jgi:hypothetical protein
MPTPRIARAALAAALLAIAGCSMLEMSPSSPRDPAARAPQPGTATKPPASAPAAAGGTTLSLSNASGAAGQRVDVSVTLHIGGTKIAGTQNDLVFDPSQIAVLPKANGKPDCTANGALGKDGTAFSFLPTGCQPMIGAGCTTVRALVLSLSNVDPIADGARLFSCKVQIGPQAKPGTQTLTMTRVGFSDPKGGEIQGGGRNGAVTVK